MTEQEIREMMCQYIDGLDHVSFKETENFCKALHQKFEEETTELINATIDERMALITAMNLSHKQALLDCRIDELERLFKVGFNMLRARGRIVQLKKQD